MTHSQVCWHPFVAGPDIESLQSFVFLISGHHLEIRGWSTHLLLWMKDTQIPPITCDRLLLTLIWKNRCFSIRNIISFTSRFHPAIASHTNQVSGCTFCTENLREYFPPPTHLVSSENQFCAPYLQGFAVGKEWSVKLIICSPPLRPPSCVNNWEVEMYLIMCISNLEENQVLKGFSGQNKKCNKRLDKWQIWKKNVEISLCCS